MPDIRPVRSALISVYHKEGLDRLALALHERGIEIWSTGGTRDFLEGLGVKTKKVEDLTLVEGTFLAGLIQAPSSYDPIRRPQQSKRRFGQALDAVVDVGVMEATEAS
mgnify:CR=1 FL=1